MTEERLEGNGAFVDGKDGRGKLRRVTLLRPLRCLGMRGEEGI